MRFARTFAHAASDLVQDPSSPDGVFAAFGIDGGCASCAAPGGIWRSADFGLTWLPSLTRDSPGTPIPAHPGQVKLTVSSTSPPVLYASGASIHPDRHALAIPASAPGTLWVGNDGGLYRTTDGGTVFESFNHTLGLIQFNGVAFHPSLPEFLMGGTQDNGNLRTLDGLSWSDRTGSDGGFVLVRGDLPSQVLAAHYYAYLNHSTTTGAVFRDVTPTPALMLEDGSLAGTSDGSLLPAGTTDGLVPIVLRASARATRFTTQLVLTNPSSSTVTVTVSYTPSSLLGGGGPGGGTVALGPGRQVEIPDVMTWLAGAFGVAGPAAPASAGGTLHVRGAVALARTSNPNPDPAVGGSFGLSYPALGAPARARSECWVLGLSQDGKTRSNLAIADARVGDRREVVYLVDVFSDASPGAGPRLTRRVVLAGGDWSQLSGILLEAGLARGHARVRVESGTSDFAAYGVLNDGATPGSRTSDGSYVPMTALH